MRITIDGPAGSGKSTVAKEVSKRLGIPYLNTGLVYRAFAYVCMQEGLEDERDILRLFERPPHVVPQVGETLVYYQGKEISPLLSSEDVGRVASIIASYPSFRERINEFFRSLMNHKQFVAEGRDAGSFIFPDADIKFFITASVEERAMRRYKQLKAQGIEITYEDVLRALVERDERDKNRPLYPFLPPKDAIVIDTTNLSVEEVVERVLSQLREYNRKL